MTASEAPLTLGGILKLPLLLWRLWRLRAVSAGPGPHPPWRCGETPAPPSGSVRGPGRSARVVVAGPGGGSSPGALGRNGVSKVGSRLGDPRRTSWASVVPAVLSLFKNI